MLSGDITVASFWATDEEKWAADYVCDGVNDDVEIQRALDEVPSSGSVLLVGPTFYIGASLWVKYNCTLGGLSISTTIHTQAGANLNDMVHFGSAIGGPYGYLTVTLRELTFDGEKATQTGGTGLILDVRYTLGLTLANVALVAAYGHAIGRSSIDYALCHLRNVDISTPNGAGIYIAGKNASKWSFTDVSISNAGTYGIYTAYDAGAGGGNPTLWRGSGIAITGSGIAGMRWGATYSMFSPLIISGGAGTVGLLLSDETCMHNVFVVSITIPLATAVTIDVSNINYNVIDNRIFGEVTAAQIGYLYTALTGTSNYNDFEASLYGVPTEISGNMPALDIVRSGPPWRQRTGVGGCSLGANYYDNEAQPRVVLGPTDLQFGPGGAAAVDTNLYRSLADVLMTDDSLVVAGSLAVNAAAISGSYIAYILLSGAKSGGLQLNAPAAWPNPAAASATILSVGGTIQVTSGGVIRGLDFNPSANTDTEPSMIYMVDARAGFGPRVGCGDVVHYNAAVPLSANNRTWLQLCGFKVVNLIGGGGGNPSCVAQAHAFYAGAISPVASVKWPNRFLFRGNDLTSGLTAADRAFGVQIDAFDASAVGMRWPVYYGDFALVAPTKSWFYDVSVGYADTTAEAATPRGTAFNLFNLDSVAQADITYVGSAAKFDQVVWSLSQIGVSAGAPVLVWEYWNGAWVAIPGLASDVGYFNQSGAVAFTPPSDWVTNAVNGSNQYWIRVRVTAAEYTTVPKCYFIQVSTFYASLPLAGINAAGIVYGDRVGTSTPLSGAPFYSTTPVNYNNSNAQNTFYSFTIPANLLVVGRVIRVTVRGIYSSIGAAAGSLTLTVDLGGDTMLSAAAALTVGMANRGWEIVGDIIVTVLGGAGTAKAEAQGQARVSTSAIAGQIWEMKNNGVLGAAFDTTANATLAITEQFSVANPGNTITARECVIEILR